MRIVFMGTPDFAAEHLSALLENHYDVCGVFTQPDKPRNRGMQLSFSPVKEVAVKYGVPVYQPAALRDGEAMEELRALQPDLLVVVAYGKILPEEMIVLPKLGTVNVHASLLPKYRGSAPIQWAVLNGDRETGVTTMYIKPEVDAGDVIYQEKTPIGEYETSGELFFRLRDIGAKLLCKTVSDIEAGKAPRKKQEENGVTHTVQLDKSMSPIDFTKPPRGVLKWIYGMQPWPCATMTVDGVTLRVLGAAYTENMTDACPGTILAANKQGIEVACGGGGTLLLTEVQSSGGRRMKSWDYLLGHPFRVETQTWK